MQTIHFPEDARPSWLVHPVLALGNFDGLHRGHQKIIDRVKRGAAEHGGSPMAMTFDPHPPRIVRPDKAPPLLMTKAQRLDALHRAGIQCVAVVRFTRELSQWDPDTFVRTVLVEWLRVSEVWVGANFLFGHDRGGNFTSLRTLGQRYGFRADKIDPVRYKDFVVSSTRIRRLVAEGRLDEAGALLGHPYYIDGTIVEGSHRGREIGFPTANMTTGNELLPPHGVYATTMTIDGIVHAGLTNIGTGRCVRTRRAAGIRAATSGRTSIRGCGRAESADRGGSAARGAAVQPVVGVGVGDVGFQLNLSFPAETRHVAALCDVIAQAVRQAGGDEGRARAFADQAAALLRESAGHTNPGTMTVAVELGPPIQVTVSGRRLTLDPA